MVRASKKLINDGFDLPLGAALALEHEVSTAANAGVSAESIEARRASVLERGRTQ